MKKFLFSYYFRGRKWCSEVYADSWEEAEEKVKAMSRGEIDGIAGPSFYIPVKEKSFLARLIVDNETVLQKAFSASVKYVIGDETLGDELIELFFKQEKELTDIYARRKADKERFELREKLKQTYDERRMFDL